MIYPEPRFLYSGDEYLTIELGDEMTLRANFMVVALNEAIRQARITGFRETFPGWRSLLLSYDSLAVKTADLIAELKGLLRQIPPVKEVPSRLIELPCKYGSPWGKDLDFVARQNNMPPAEVVRIHSETIHWTGMVGFTPGSPQLMQLNPEVLLSTPKYVSPRLYTPTGAVALGGSITAHYPVVSPGGYQLIGLCPVPIYDRFQTLAQFEESPVLLRIGDRIKYQRVEGEEFDHIRQLVIEYRYQYRITQGAYRLPD
ncbi:MAG: allophanate hydrolase subunit 1 [Desulfarculus sp.]|jgi:KipI family sensor histidine kinase inhibitor|nr:MAG: allophanate hydrolase subunit 1 [Desulfarculus sp.]